MAGGLARKRGLGDTIGYIVSLLGRSAPLVLGSISTYLISFTDHFMTRGFGQDTLTGIYLSNQIIQLATYLIIGVETVTATRCATAAQAEDRRRHRGECLIGMVFGTSIALLTTIVCIIAPSLPLSLLGADEEIINTGRTYLLIVAISLIPYSITRTLLGALRASGNGAPTLASALISLGANVAFNYLFIYGRFSLPMLGAVGAGVSTLLSRLIEAAYVVFILVRSGRQDRDSSPKKRNPRTSYDITVKLGGAPRSFGYLIDFSKMLFPILAAQAVWGASNLILSRTLTSLGGESGAALSVAGSLFTLFFSVASGISAAGGVRTARILKRGDISAFATHYRSELILLSVLGAMLSVLLIALAPSFISLYRISGNRLIEGYIFAYAVSFPPAFLATALSYSILKSGGKERAVMLLDLGVLLLYTLPLAFILPRIGISPFYILLALRGEHLIKLVATLFLISRLTPIDKRSRVW